MKDFGLAHPNGWEESANTGPAHRDPAVHPSLSGEYGRVHMNAHVQTPAPGIEPEPPRQRAGMASRFHLSFPAARAAPSWDVGDGPEDWGATDGSNVSDSDDTGEGERPAPLVGWCGRRPPIRDLCQPANPPLSFCGVAGGGALPNPGGRQLGERRRHRLRVRRRHPAAAPRRGRKVVSGFLRACA